MEMSEFRFKIFLLQAFCVFLGTVNMTCGIISIQDYFGETYSTDCTLVKWAHAVNTREKLKKALEDGEVMMIEADIMIGKTNDSTIKIPVMAHSPTIETDLSFDEFMNEIIQAVKVKNKTKKGIKLDFKEIEAAEIGLKSLEYLDKLNQLKFPVWINADILQGPVNSTKSPVNADRFLELVHKHLPTSTLSIGWVTRYGRDDIKDDLSNPRLRTITHGEYTREHIHKMINLIENFGKGWENPITFPVRAGLAANSEGVILHLINSIFDRDDVSITLWSKEDDPVDLMKLRLLIGSVTREKTFIDLPFDVKTGPIIIPDIKLNLINSTNRLTTSVVVLFVFVILMNLINIAKY